MLAHGPMRPSAEVTPPKPYSRIDGWRPKARNATAWPTSWTRMQKAATGTQMRISFSVVTPGRK